MPVLSLPEFLGLQEAPQAPVFQRTNQLRRPTDWERFVQTADAVTALRQQRPMAQIQAIQNEYDTIRDNADKLRREREATMQAEQAVSALAGLTPESDDYLTQRRRIMTQFPSAVLDPRVQSVIDDSDRMFNTRQSAMARMEEERLNAEAARAEEIQKRATSLIEMGESPEQARKIAVDPYAAAQAKYQRGMKPQGSPYEKPLDVIQNMIKAVPEDERYDYKDGERIVRPEFQALLERQKKLADAYFGELEGRKPVDAGQDAAISGTATAPQIQIPFRPGVAPAEVSPQPIIPTPATPATLEQEISRVPVTQQAEWLKRRKEQETETQRINEEWTKARNSLESRLKQKYPDKPYPGLKTSPLEQLALQIVNGVTVADSSIPTAGDAALEIPIADKVLLDLGEDIFGKKPAFTEPGSKRKSLFGLIGSQDVTHGELIRDWAEKFARSRNLIRTPLAEKQGISPEERQKGVNVLDKYVPASNG